MNDESIPCLRYNNLFKQFDWCFLVAMAALSIEKCFVVINLTEDGRKLITDIISSIGQSTCYRRKGICDSSNEYLAISSCVHNKLSNCWFTCHSSSSLSDKTLNNAQFMSCGNHATWYGLIDELQKCNVSSPVDDVTIAGNLHKLLDDLPWRPNNYCVMDVLLVADDSSNRSLSPLLYSALWRMEEWMNARFTLIKSDANIDKLLSTLEQALPLTVVSINSLNRIFSRPVICSCPLFPPIRHSLSLNRVIHLSPRMTLALSYCDNEDLANKTGLYINDDYHPTHFELIKIVDTRTFPLVWVSPIQVTLHSRSLAFHKLIGGVSDNTGVLLKLCGQHPNSLCAFSHKKTEEWKLHILEKETCNTVPSMTDALDCCCGPVVLVKGLSTEDSWYNGWMLWKQEYPQSFGTRWSNMYYSMKVVKDNTEPLKITEQKGNVR
jgi:hypothetical protein